VSIKAKKFYPGDYVCVVDGIFDAGMPDDGRRDGLVVEIRGRRRDQALVMFHNKKFLKFHKSQLILLEKLRNTK
jgi:hypothetical protein